MKKYMLVGLLLVGSHLFGQVKDTVPKQRIPDSLMRWVKLHYPVKPHPCLIFVPYIEPIKDSLIVDSMIKDAIKALQFRRKYY